MLEVASFIRGCMNPFISREHQAALDRIAFLEQRLTELQAEGTRLVLANRDLRHQVFNLQADYTAAKNAREMWRERANCAEAQLELPWEQMRRIPTGLYDASRYDTDNEHVVHLWADGKSYELRVKK